MGPLLQFLGPFGLFFGSGSGSKTFLELTNVDYQFVFWKYSHIFLFWIRPNFGPFRTFRALQAIFGVGVRFKNFFGTYLHRLITFYFGSIALSCWFPAKKYYSGRPVGRSDGEAELRTSTAQLKLELGLSLAILIVIVTIYYATHFSLIIYSRIFNWHSGN